MCEVTRKNMVWNENKYKMQYEIGNSGKKDKNVHVMVIQKVMKINVDGWQREWSKENGAVTDDLTREIEKN